MADLKDYENARAVVDVLAEGWGAPKTFVIWGFAGCKSIREAARGAAKQYAETFGHQPEFAFVRQLPGSTDEGVEIDGMTVFSAEWMPPGCAAVGWTQLIGDQ